MGRRLDNSDRGALISVESARRIAEVVRKVEGGDRNIPPLPLRTAYDDGGGEVRIGKVSVAWARETCATVTIWEEGDECVPGESSPAETIEDVANLSFDVAADSWVVIAQAANGRWYLVQAGDPPDAGACKPPAVGGEDLTTVEGYDAAKTQLLGHEAGCLKWIDTIECDTGSGS